MAPKVLRYRILPDGPTEGDITVCKLRYVPVYASPEQGRWTGWKARSHAEHGTNPAILPPLRAKLGKGIPTIAVYSDGLVFRACESGAIVDAEQVRERRQPKPRIWTGREQRHTWTLPSGSFQLLERTRELDDLGEYERTDPRGLFVPILRQTAQAPIGEVVGQDNIIRPTDSTGKVRY